LSESEYAVLETASKAAGFKTVSEYVRHATIGGGEGVNFAAEVRDDIRKILNILQKTKK
jgi:hypothetical protein